MTTQKNIFIWFLKIKFTPFPIFPLLFCLKSGKGVEFWKNIFGGFGPRYPLLVYQIRAQKQGTSSFSVISWDIIWPPQPQQGTGFIVSHYNFRTGCDPHLINWQSKKNKVVYLQSHYDFKAGFLPFTWQGNTVVVVETNDNTQLR